MESRFRGARRGVAALVSVFLACSSSPSPDRPAGGPPDPLHRKPVQAVASVAISLDRERVPPEREESFVAHGGEEELRAALERALREQGKLRADSPFRLEVVVSRYRLRSTTTVVLLPGVSGRDSLGALAIVREGERTVRTVPSVVELMRPFEWPSSASRLTRLVDGLSARVARAL